jgi:hypothetical protein
MNLRTIRGTKRRVKPQDLALEFSESRLSNVAASGHYLVPLEFLDPARLTRKMWHYQGVSWRFYVFDYGPLAAIQTGQRVTFDDAKQ